VKRFRRFCHDKPLSAWFLTVTFLLGLYLTAYQFLGPQNPLWILLLFSMALAAPTHSLLERFSDTELQQSPVLAEEEKKAGAFSLLAALCSIGSLLCPVLLKRLHVSLPDSSYTGLLLVFPVSVIFSLILGYAGRRSKAGRCGLVLTLGWPLLLVIASVLLSSHQ